MARRVTYGQSGYDGSSMSLRAREAHNNGRYPASKAARIYGFKNAALLRQHINPSEWHHTSKYANETAFYDVTAFWETASLGELESMLPDLTKTGLEKIQPYIQQKKGSN